MDIDLKQLGDEVFAVLLAEDAAERTEGDDRRHLQTSQRRAAWPDLTAVPPSTQMGMSVDHAHVYGELLPVFEGEFRAAYARRDPKIVYPEKQPVHLSFPAEEKGTNSRPFPPTRTHRKNHPEGGGTSDCTGLLIISASPSLPQKM
ncbi:MAG: hypothetical protein KGL35_28105 [Bradyrhizobium sp.]|nr:hypothetical protein [Pseudomonadota bacterium]MDE2472486.1 hypothetical protein [Bradyrhizobium sp.]